jgi:hypothetical protein
MMKTWLILTACLSPAIAQQAPLYFSGTIAGNVRGDDGTAIAGAYLSLQLQPPYVKSRHLETEWTLRTGSDGSFQFTGLNGGSYRICGYLPHGAWLNPCAWGLQPPTVTLSSAQPAATVTLTLKQGAVVPIRVNDPNQLLPQYEGKSPGADLLIGVVSDSGIFAPASIVSQDSGGRYQQVVIPFGAMAGLRVFSAQFQLSSGGAPLPKATTTIPVTVPSGQQPPTITLQVTGRSALQNN